MRILSTLFMAACLVPVLAGSASAADLAKGKADFTEYCAPCHGVTGQGNGPVATELTKKPIDLTALAMKAGGKFDRAIVKKIVDGRDMPRAHGTPQMPVWGQWFSYQATAGGLLQEDRAAIEKQVTARLENLVEFLQTIQKQ